MKLPDDLLERPADEATRRIAWALLDEAHAGIQRMERGDDDEALHDFRVAIRRLRSLARAHTRHLGDAIDKKGRKALRKLQRMTGGARDTEVQLDWVRQFRKELTENERQGIAGLIASFEATMSGAMDGVPAKVRKRFGKLEPKLRSRLETRTIRWDEPSESYGAVLGGLARVHAAEVASLLEDITSMESQQAIHDARIAGKRLRYLLEPARPHTSGAKPIVKKLKVLQDVLGDLHDMHVLAATIQKAIDEGDITARPGLEALGRETHAYALRCFDTQQKKFAGKKLQELVTAVDMLAQELEGPAPAPNADLEIERKYLLTSVPERARRHDVTELAQGYLPGSDVRERLRRAAGPERTRYLRTIKAGRGIARIEIEEETTAKVFDVMWPLTEGSRVVKRRFAVPDGDFVWEIDEFLDRELVLAEVELPSADIEPKIPDWLEPHLVREVTGDDAYVNVNLAK